MADNAYHRMSSDQLTVQFERRKWRSVDKISCSASGQILLIYDEMPISTVSPK